MIPKFLEIAREWRELKDEKSAMAEREKEVNARLKQIEVDILPPMMDENDITNVKLDGIGSIYQQVEVYANVKKENEALFHAWLREHGHEDLIRETVFAATLKAFVKERLEDGEDLPDFIGAMKIPTARLRRT